MSKRTPEEQRQYQRERTRRYYFENHEKMKAYRAEWARKKAAKEAAAAGRIPGKKGPPVKFTEEEKRAKRKAKTERWNALNKDKYLEKAKLRERAKRAGTFVSRARSRLTKEERRAVDITHSAIRRARVRGNGGTFSASDIPKLRWRQNGLCPICIRALGEHDIHLDHWEPLKLGGKNDFNNLRLTHGACNLKKGARHPRELGLEPAMAA